MITLILLCPYSTSSFLTSFSNTVTSSVENSLNSALLIEDAAVVFVTIVSVPYDYHKLVCNGDLSYLIRILYTIGLFPFRQTR